jgi:hypothetical protein
MPYRRSNRYQQRIAARQRAMREGKARARMEREMPERWEPPDLRRRLIVEDYDSGSVHRTVIDMHATPRIDCYRVAIDGKPQPGRLGWSRILGMLRVAMPRKCSPRWVQG